MAKDVKLGTIKPEYMARAANLKQAGQESFTASKKASSMARHPAVKAAGRSSEFHAQAEEHLGAAKQARSEARSLAKSTGGSFTPNASHTASRSNAAQN